ncbi:MAG: YjbQ family protein, partial [Sphingomonadales bacterium]|nr:YjbQ family protein [Sphingomonadales bacterium]
MSVRQTTILTIETPGKSLTDFTREIVDWVAESGVATGLLPLFIRHTSASLLIQENAAAEVRDDLID